jgi:hypothetical protein
MKMDVKPIIGPLVNLLRSRKFLVAVISLALDIVIAYSPGLEGQREMILMATNTIISAAVILGIAHEDAAEKAAG